MFNFSFGIGLLGKLIELEEGEKYFIELECKKETEDCISNLIDGFEPRKYFLFADWIHNSILIYESNFLWFFGTKEKYFSISFHKKVLK